jgi:hypothetical protein
MLRRRISSAAIVVGLMLPAVVGCLVTSATQAQAAECCAQVNCARGQQKQTCFSTTAPTGSSQSTPELRISLMAPAIATGMSLPPTARDAAAFSSAGIADAPQHSPPELYTLHLALLL